MGSLHTHSGIGAVAAVQCRHRSDHSAVFLKGHPNRFLLEDGLFAGLAVGSLHCAKPQSFDRSVLGCRARFRHRILARACGLVLMDYGFRVVIHPDLVTFSAATRARLAVGGRGYFKTMWNPVAHRVRLEITANLQDRIITAATVVLPFKIDDHWRGGCLKVLTI